MRKSAIAIPRKLHQRLLREVLALIQLGLDVEVPIKQVDSGEPAG